MNTEIKVYSIPTNPYIKKGHIYTLYINNINNLDLFPIITNNYTKLLELNKESQELIKQIIKERNKQ